MAMSSPDNIELHLLDYSADQEVPYLPVFVQGRFYKRISRQEIKGWSAHPPELFLKENSPKRAKQNSKLKTIDFVAKKNTISKPMLNSDRNKELQNARENIVSQNSEKTSLFKTFREIPEANSKTSQQAQVHQQQQKLDFIKGRKLVCRNVPHILIVKPFFTSFSIRNKSCKSQNSYRSQQKPSIKTLNKSLSKQKSNAVSMISYPIDSSITFQRDSQTQQTRVATFLRKFRR